MKSALIATLTIYLLCQLAYNQELSLCHYTCQTCQGQQYYECQTCPQNRGIYQTNQPISGMCYCSNGSDEDDNGNCTEDNQFNHNNKTVIAVLIGISLFIGVIQTLLRGMRYFLIKNIEDIQQLSIVVLINLYFPQQFDIFLTSLYRFNMSSYTLEAITDGNLFDINTNNEFISSTDGQNIYGKYKLLYKTANFLSNQFTWILIAVSLLVVGLLIKVMRNKIYEKQKRKNQTQHINVMNQTQQQIMDNTKDEKISNIIHEGQKNKQSNNKEFQKVSQNASTTSDTAKNKNTQINFSLFFRIVNKISNILWFNFYITFFYLSLIEINLNIFTQISNLTFSSSFAAFGAYLSAFFLAGQCIILFLLIIKARQQFLLPEWLRDHTFTAPIYLIRTNYKILTRYFWFFSCLKKILISLFLTIFYSSPIDAIISISVIQAVYLGFSLYLQPYERRYIRIHFYLMEAIKLLIYMGLVNFTQKYVEYARMIELTKIFYSVMVFVFSLNLFYILCNLIAERPVYYRSLRKIFCPQDKQNSYMLGKIGYHSEGKLYIYQKQ